MLIIVGFQSQSLCHGEEQEILSALDAIYPLNKQIMQFFSAKVAHFTISGRSLL